jgi:hypothetical protein
MLILDGANDLITVVTDASAAIKVHASWVDNDAGALTAGRTNTASITSATTTTVVAAPGASKQRSVRHLNIRNDHASTQCTVTVNHTDGTNVEPVFKTVLAAGEEVVLGENGVWVYYDANGKPYMSIGPIATQADMEAASSLTLAVPPGRLHNHPGVAKFVCMTTGGASPVSQSPPAYNLTSITDSGAGRLTVTIATDFSSANWCCQVSCEYSSTTITNASVWALAHIRSATLAAGTVEVNFHNWVTITSTLVDPTSCHVVGYGDHA